MKMKTMMMTDLRKKEGCSWFLGIYKCIVHSFPFFLMKIVLRPENVQRTHSFFSKTRIHSLFSSCTKKSQLPISKLITNCFAWTYAHHSWNFFVLHTNKNIQWVAFILTWVINTWAMWEKRKSACADLLH